LQEQRPERRESVGSGQGRTHFIPIQGTEELLGIVGLQVAGSPVPLLPGQHRLLETFVSQVALAIARTRLAEKARHAELLQVTERLQTALLNSISHDLRTPLATITGALSSLRDKTIHLEAGVQQELIETALEEAERMNRLVGNLLDMTRLEAGAMTLTKTLCDVQDLLGVVLAQQAGHLQNRPLTLELPADLPLVPMDFVLVAQVVGNLLDNALKYSPAGTPLGIVASVSNHNLTLTLCDHGMGIPEVELPHVFDKFYRILRPDQASGTGLGLSISKGIIEAHGGTIGLHSRLGKGTTAWLKLPLATPSSEQEGQP
ncbi:MAG: sensor histidine kinase KdpD, partial [Ardenticatenales bacterium]|nr:sensor histidine kinase KdpD [Ardenticatenales bacterium]